MAKNKKFCIILTFSEVKRFVKDLEKDGAGMWELEKVSKDQLSIGKKID